MKRTILMIAAAALLVGGCSDNQSKRTEKPAQLGGGTQAAAEIAWTVPEGWTEETPSNAMRKAQFLLPRAEGDTEDASVVITFFPGEGNVGGIDANIQRWYSQMSQPDGGPTSEVAETTKDTINGLEHTRVSMTGTYNGGAMMGGQGTSAEGYKMIATQVKSSAGPYFVKMVGPEATVNKWEASFDAFLASFTEG